MQRLSIAFVRQRYTQDGGAERFVARTLETLKGQDVRITLITREWKPGDGFEVTKVNPFYIGRLWRDWSFARAVCKLLKTRKFDLVQSHERIPCCDIYRAGDGVHREWLKQHARVLSWWGRLMQAINPYHLYVKWAEKRVFMNPRLQAVICNSKMVREEIKHYFGIADNKLHVIYNGVDLNQFHPDLRRHRAEVRARYAIPGDAPLFLFVGSGFERKGIPILLETMAELPSNTYLLVVGRDRKLEQYRGRAAALGMIRRVHFVGSQSDVGPYYGAADALVLPTLYDPFPNVALEAMAAGLPVVTSRNCGAAELVKAGVDGFVCDALDRGCLVEALRTVTTRNVAIANPRERVISLTLVSMSEALQRLYLLIASRAQ